MSDVPLPLEAKSRVSMRGFLGVFLVGAFTVAIGALFFRAIPKDNEQLLTYMLGQLSGFVSAVVAFSYTLNQLNERATRNTGEMLRTMRAQAEASGQPAPSAPQADPAPEVGADTDLKG